MQQEGEMQLKRIGGMSKARAWPYPNSHIQDRTVRLANSHRDGHRWVVTLGSEVEKSEIPVVG